MEYLSRPLQDGGECPCMHQCLPIVSGWYTLVQQQGSGVHESM